MTPLEELQQQYGELLHQASDICRLFDDGENVASEIAEWEQERDELCAAARAVWLKDHPDSDPTPRQLDNWLGGNEVLIFELG